MSNVAFKGILYPKVKYTSSDLPPLALYPPGLVYRALLGF